MKNGLVVSDLHLFSGRSDGERLMATLEESVGQVDLFVLNGDIFDFRWSELGSEEETIHAAIEWLDRLLKCFGGDRVHYILGNHDCLIEFHKALGELAHRNPVFCVHAELLVLKGHLFLHGDCVNRNMDGAALRRLRDNWSRDRQRGPVGRALYSRADQLGLSHRFHKHYFPEAPTIQRLAYHLDQILPAWREEISHCYFGHTHMPFKDHMFDGVKFANTGSAIRGMGFLPVRFSF